MIKILMVCLGNICRSPLADGLLKSKGNDSFLEIEVDSCGTSKYHAGQQPDYRMIKTARLHGYDISDLKSRPISSFDLDYFDIIYVMDESNYRNVRLMCEDKHQEDKIHFLLNEIYPDSNMPVPDPYFGGANGFENVFNLIDKATNIIVEKLKNNSLV